ncbi:MAG: cytochrome P450 [Thermoanaerobaculia bacterium]
MSTNGSVPPGPPGRFLLGNLVEFGTDVLGFFESCARDYGDIVSLRIGSWPALFLNHPDHFDTVLLANNRNFIKHTFFWRHVTEIFGKGLVTNEGAPWLRQRRLMQPAFHRERIHGYGETMVEYAERMLGEWDREAAAVRDVHDDMMRVTMEIATKTLFGADLSHEEAAEIGAAFDDAIVEIANRFRRAVKIPRWIPIPSNRRYAAAVRRLDRLVYDMLERKRTAGGGHDLLTMLIEARDEDGSAMDSRQIRDEAVTIFLAGHETTAIALSWTFHLLAAHPEVEERILAEVREVVGEGRPTAADMPRLTYTGNVISESMRLFPPAYAFGREAIADCEIGGYRVPAGTTIFMSPWVIHRDPRWYDDPLAFRPERWENDFAKTLPRFAYLPFGGGPRICIGSSFALMEAVLLLVSVLRRYELRMEGQAPKPFPSITLRPYKGMPMRVARRPSSRARGMT